MLRINQPGIAIADADFPSPFPSGAEYSSPARGTWNIVHTGMLIPEAHQIFVCAAGCLRGVVLTAAEMNASHRFSTIEVRNNNILDGTMEDLIIDGTADILSHLSKIPPAVLIYTSCVHHFTGCDTEYAFSELSRRFKNIDFVHCYMNPIMRKSGLNPDQLMRRQLYSLLKPARKNPYTVCIIGNDLPTDTSSELNEIITGSGHNLKDITDCKNYAEYLSMSESSLNITTYPAAFAAGEALEKRLGITHIHLPVCFSYKEIETQTDKLCTLLGTAELNHSAKQQRCEERLISLKELLGNTPVAVDYTAVSCPFELAEYLVLRGINVTAIYADSVSAADKSAFYHLKELAPHIAVYPTVSPEMRVIPRKSEEKIIAVGQKAAYFTGSDNFVNIIENGGHWGYDGILRLADEIEDAFLHTKNAEKLIQIKGWGCGCC